MFCRDTNRYFALFAFALAILASPAYSTAVDSCQNLSNASDTYALSQPVSMNDSACFNVTAANVTLDCAGFQITGNNSTGTVGIYSDQFNTSVVNCIVSNFQDSISFNGSTNGTIQNTSANSTYSNGNGILFTSVNYSTIVNSTTYAPGGYGIRLKSASNFNALTGVTSRGLIGIDVYSSSGNTLANSTVNSTGSNYGIAFQASANSNTVTNVSASGVAAVFFGSSSSFNTLASVTAYSASSSGFYLSASSANNTIANSTATTGGFFAMYVWGVNFNTFSNISLAAGGTGIYVKGTSAGNTFTRITSLANTESILMEGFNNTIANSTLRSNLSTAAYFDLTSSGNTLANNSLISGNGAGTLVYHAANSSGNTFYWNNFTATTGMYVNDTNGSNFYNTTMNGTAAGNIWANVLNSSVSILGSVSSAFPGLYYGSSGSGYPYNAATSQGKVASGVTDYGPLTQNNYAVIAVYLMSPQNGQYVNNNTPINFRFNYSSSNGASMLCEVYVNNSTYAGSIGAAMVNNSTAHYFTPSPYADGSYTWFANCTNVTSGETNTSAIRSFIVESSPPLITYANRTEPDSFYSMFPGNDVIHLNVTANGTGSNVTSITANLTNSMANETLASVSLTFNSTTGCWNGSFNATPFIASMLGNGTMNRSNPVVGLDVLLWPVDQANNTGFRGNDSTVTVLLHDLGSFQGPPAQISCFREGNGTTNMSHILNFNAVNLVQVMMMNGSQECHYNMTGMNQSLPWGSSFRTMAMFNFTSVDLSTQEKAGQAMSAMGNLIRPQIAPPHSFGISRIFVNTTNFSALNTSAVITLYDLPFGATPTVVGDNGSMVTNITWSQGEYNSSFNCSIGNLTIRVGSFSGYNITDNTSPSLSVLLPVAGSNTTNPAVVINVSANGTGTEISALTINVTSGAASYAYHYTNATNTANCTQLAAGSENITCQINITLAQGAYSLNVSAYDYGGSSPGNYYSSQQSFAVDYTAPETSPSAPANSSNSTAHNVTFTWTATDALRTNITCNLTIDGAVNRSNLQVTNGTAYSTAATANFSDGPHNWSVRCWDDLPNVNSTMPAYYFTVQSSVSGNASSINATGLGTLNATINGTEAQGGANYSGVLGVNVSSGGSALLLFDYNFSYQLNFSNLVLTNGTLSGKSHFSVSGANGTGGQTGTKTFVIYGASSAYNAICAKNAEGVNASNITSDCSASDETRVKCDNVAVNGFTCSQSGTTLTITGLRYSAVLQYLYTATTTTTTSGGNSGGGSVGGGYSAASSSTSSEEVRVDVGSNVYCTVVISREISRSDSLSKVTTTLENLGGSGCALSDFEFSDTIPPDFSEIGAIAFSPAYSALSGTTVSFEFPLFSPGESKTISYSVEKWVPSSRLASFATYSMSAATQAAQGEGKPAEEKEERPPIAPTVPGRIPIEEPSAPSAQPGVGPGQAGQDWLPSGAGALAMFLSVVLIGAALYFFAFRKKRRGL